MGLLGGFKGKLFGKEKKPKKEEVVCVKIKTFSEFDDISVPSTSNGNVGRLDVVRDRRRPSKPELKNIFEKVKETPTTSVKLVPIKKENEIEQKNDSDDKKLLINNSDDNANFINIAESFLKKNDNGIRSKRGPPPFIDSEGEDDGNFKINIVDNHDKIEEFKESGAPSKRGPPPFIDFDDDDGNFKINIVGSSEQNYTTVPTPSKRGPPPFIDSDEDDDDGNFKINIVGSSEQNNTPVITPSKRGPPPFIDSDEDNDGNFKVNIVGSTERRGPPPFIDSDEDSESSQQIDRNVARAESPFLEDNDGNFKINFVNGPEEDNEYKVHLNQTFGSASEEESEEEEERDTSPVNYSSQAASIFFGGEEEPAVSRPRNIVFNEDEEDGNFSDGSSASA